MKLATMAGSCHAASSSSFWFTAFRIEVIEDYTESDEYRY